MASSVRLPTSLVRTWMGLAMVPLIGSLITEPAAMTLAAPNAGSAGVSYQGARTTQVFHTGCVVRERLDWRHATVMVAAPAHPTFAKRFVWQRIGADRHHRQCGPDLLGLFD